MAAALVLGCGAAAKHRAPQRSLVDYRRTGGIAGVDVRLVVQNDGRATLTTGRLGPPRGGTLPSRFMKELRSTLARADFGQLKGSYTPDRPVYDGFTYAISHDGRTVEASDFAVPRQLQPLIDALERSINHLRGDDKGP